MVDPVRRSRPVGLPAQASDGTSAGSLMRKPLPNAAIEVSELRVGMADGVEVVHDVTFSVGWQQILGLVGESGAGKTTTALALLGYAQRGMQITGGTVRVAGQALDLGNEAACRQLRGRLISYVPQDPLAALNPTTRLGDAIREMIRQHSDDPNSDVAAVLERVQLPTDRAFLKRYPHELSGGQQQRLCIAIALSCNPSVIVLDEPTTGLDVITQSVIVDQLLDLRQDQGVSMVYVSHNLAVISQLADKLAVMYSGRVVETGPMHKIVEEPLHPYTRGLVGAVPDHRKPSAVRGIPGRASESVAETTGCAFASRCLFRTAECEAEVPALATIEDGRQVRCIHVDHVRAMAPDVWRVLQRNQNQEGRNPILEVDRLHASNFGSHRIEQPVVRGVSFSVSAGECVALVGESGSGKTTIARTVVGLHARSKGSIQIQGERLKAAVRDRTRNQRRIIQLIFQNPESALNPRQRVGESIARAATVLRYLDRRSAAHEVEAILRDVRLPVGIARRYPGELSGGEVQRVALARALAARPEILICDEVTSALDVSVQAAILDLLRQLRAERGLAVLFITHDLGVVATIADRVLVLENGTICEHGPVDEILNRPQHPYTRRLLDAAPSLAGSSVAGS